MADTGVKFPSAQAVTQLETLRWTTPGNLFADDGANASFGGSPGSDPDQIAVTGFGAAVPGGATILGIEITAEVTAITSNPFLSVHLTKNGTGLTAFADDVAAIGVKTIGGPTSLFSNTWTPAEINASTFGLILIGTSGVASYSFAIDYVAIKVYYSGGSDETKKTASDAAAGDQLGVSAAASATGAVVAAGAWHKPVATSRGALYIWSGTSWSKETKKVPSDVADNDGFGWACAISDDGRVVVGTSPNKGSLAGAAYLFSGVGWATETKKVPSVVEMGAQFGYSVALSGDGKVLVVGAPYQSGGGLQRGRVYVFSGVNWGTEKVLAASDAADYAWFGWGVGVSYDGSVIAVGAPKAAGGGTQMGCVYIYTGANWTTETKKPPFFGNNGDQFGGSVAVAGAGTHVLGSCPGDPDKGVGAGTVRLIFAASFGTQNKVSASDGAAGDHFGGDLLNFGRGVAVSSDGSLVAIGAESNAGGGTGRGALYLRSGVNWTTETKKTGSDVADNEHLGSSVALSDDGYVAVAGANSVSAAAGAVYLFGQPAFPVPVGYWALDESPAIHGTSIDDNSGNGHIGTLSTGEGSTGKAVAGKIGGAIHFDGVDDYIFVTTKPVDGLGASDFTITAWIKDTSDQTAPRFIIARDDEQPGGRQFQLNLHASQLHALPGILVGGIFASDTSYVQVETAGGSITPNVWHHVVFRRLSGVLSLWLNGVSMTLTVNPQGGGTQGLTIQNTNAECNIGARSYVGSRCFFAGDLDEVAIYARGLSNTEIISLYSVGVGPLAEKQSLYASRRRLVRG